MSRILRNVAICALLVLACGNHEAHGDETNRFAGNDDASVTDGSTVSYGPALVGGLFYPACRKAPPQVTSDLPTSTVYEYCPDAIVNGVSVECRQYWMRQAMQVQFNGSAGSANSKCPTSFFGSLAVNHSDTSPQNYHDSNGNNCGAWVAQSAGRRGSLDDPSNHAEVNVTRVIANKYRGNGRNRSFWGWLTEYTTGESCSMCATHQLFAGYKEVVYGVRIGAFNLIGQGQTKLTSLDVLRSGINWSPYNPQVLIGQVLVEEMYHYFAWNNNVNQPNYPCPTGCGVHGGANRCTNNP